MKKKQKSPYHIGQIVDCNKQSVEIIDIKLNNIVDYKTNRSRNHYFYDIKCLDCKETTTVREESLKTKSGCSVCSNHTVVKGINDMWTTSPHIAKLLRYKTDGYNYTKSCTHVLEFCCPICGYYKHSKVNDVYNKGLSCPKCGSSTSYCEKLMLNLLDNISMDYVFQYQPSWSQGKRYDFYLPKYNTIIEIHGMQHYQHVNHFHSNNKNKNFKSEQDNDTIKKELARKNNICKYIELDCRKSTLEHFRKTLLNCVELQEIIDFSKVDWDYCAKHSLSRKVYEACILYNQGDNIEVISQKMNTSQANVKKYLIEGGLYSLCNFSGRKRQVYNVEKNIVFQSLTDLSRQFCDVFGTTITQSYLSRKFKKSDTRVIRGYTFKMVSEQEVKEIKNKSA